MSYLNFWKFVAENFLLVLGFHSVLPLTLPAPKTLWQMIPASLQCLWQGRIHRDMFPQRVPASTLPFQSGLTWVVARICPWSCKPTSFEKAMFSSGWAGRCFYCYMFCFLKKLLYMLLILKHWGVVVLAKYSNTKWINIPSSLNNLMAAESRIPKIYQLSFMFY